MARMLYLRDIEVDVDVRCCACGHEGVLPRAAMLRRFGPNYPVLSIAPHYRCSRCDSRDTESRPAAPPVTLGADVATEDAPPSFAGPLAALQGLLDAVRGRGDEEEEHEAPLPALAPEPTVAPAPAIIARPLPSLELEDLIADTTPPEAAGRRPLWEPVSLADMAAERRDEGPDEPEPDDIKGDESENEEEEDAGLPRPFAIADAGPLRSAPEDEDDPVAHFNRTIAALRGMLGDDDAPREMPRPKEPRRPAVVDRGDPPEDDEPTEDEIPEVDPAEDDPEDEDIVAFAIRDPEKAPPRRELAAGPEEQPLDKTLAALRNLVHEAAADPNDDSNDEEDEADDVAPEDLPDDLTAGWRRERDADEPAVYDAEDEEDDAEEPPSPRKSAQEMDMEEALRALRALVEQEDDEEDDPLPALPPTPIPLRAGRPTMAELMERARRDEEYPEEDPFETPDGPTDRKAAPPFPTPIPLGVAPDEDDDEPLDLVDMVEDPRPEPKPEPRKGAPKGGETKGGDRGESSSLDKTIAALRSMLELDGKRGR